MRFTATWTWSIVLLSPHRYSLQISGHHVVTSSRNLTSRRYQAGKKLESTPDHIISYDQQQENLGFNSRFFVTERIRIFITGHFRVVLNLIMKMRLSTKFFIMKSIGFDSYAKNTDFNLKSFALSLAFIMRSTANRKWPVIIVTPVNE